MSSTRQTVADPPEPLGKNSHKADHCGWQKSLSNAIRSRSELLDRQGLSSTASTLLAGEEQFPVLVPESYMKRMRYGDPSDPLLLQVLPTGFEAGGDKSGQLDPTGDLFSKKVPGLLHKYHGRALLIAHGSCAIHCRYCFRRHYPYQDDPRSEQDWTPALDLLTEDLSIHEVILSGGDPLLLSDRRLHSLISRLEAIPHLRRLRIHSRLPVVLPDRVTAELIELLRSTRLQSIVVVHANHPKELVDDCAAALRDLVASGIPVLNQAVLLKNVNDDVETLVDLCERSIDLGVMPYYLHQLDRVQGATHFEVPIEQGRSLIEGMRERLPGYALPRYVSEHPGEKSKTPLGESVFPTRV